MKVAILGASSQIAKDLTLSFYNNCNYDLTLFGRNLDFLKVWQSKQVNNLNYKVFDYSDFDIYQNYDVILNFIGIGDPAKRLQMGKEIIRVTEKYDLKVLDYIKIHQNTKYIFLSSGAVYGGEFKEAADVNTISSVDISSKNLKDFYAIAKLQAENRHRKLSHLSIVDIRVFNYFSHTQDMNAGFLMNDIVRAIKSGEVLKTSSQNITRDFITPLDFFNFIKAIISFNEINIALDCYTKNPIAKFDLLDECIRKFGLYYEIDKSFNFQANSGLKINYFSKNKNANKLGYRPIYSSLEAIILECNLLFNSK